MLSERHKIRTIEADSTGALFSGGLGRSSVEASVMEVEKRAGVKLPGRFTSYKNIL
jgi:hypothetical protein